MTDRIQKLKNNIVRDKYEVVVTKSALFTEAYKKFDGDPDIVRTAKAQAYMLDNIPIFILEGDMIPVAPASVPLGTEADFWTRGVWTEKSVEVMKDPKNAFYVTDETGVKMLELSEYWRKYVPEYKMLDLFGEKMWAWKRSGFHLPPNKTVEQAAGGGLAVSDMSIFPEQEFTSVDYGYILKKGMNAVIEEAKAELAKVDEFDLTTEDAVERVYALRAMIIIDEAFVRWVGRYADLAQELADKETCPKRKAEYLKMVDTCRRVPGNPAETFLDALTFQWAVFCMVNYMNCTPIERVDQWLYPYYEKEIKAGTLTREEALEYIECYRLKFMQIKSTSGGATVKKWSGQANWRGMTLGGVKRDGTDATNDLTYLIIEAAKDCQTPFPTISLRVHKDTPLELMKKAIDLVKTGIGYPSFNGDVSYISSLTNREVPLELARDYYIIGCLDVNAPEAWGQLFSMVVNALPLDSFLHRGYSPTEGQQIGPDSGDPREMKTFDEFYDKLMEQMEHFMHCYAADRMIRFLVRKNFLQDAFIVSCMSDGVKVGLSPFRRKQPYKLGPGISVGCGTINVAQSLYIIKKLVYEEKKITMDELIAALDANWEGERAQEIRKMCVSLPRYGNDEEDVDAMVGKLYNSLCDIAGTLESVRRIPYNAAAVSITSHDPGGKLMGATPDGRYALETLADGCASPIQGDDCCGPTAVFKSALHIPSERMNSLLLNMKIAPSALKTEEDAEKLAYLIHGYLDNGGKQVQFNVVDQATLLDAKAHPEKHKDLIVRVAGYSAYFNILSGTVQDEIIKRTSHDQL